MWYPIGKGELIWNSRQQAYLQEQFSIGSYRTGDECQSVIEDIFTGQYDVEVVLMNEYKYYRKNTRYRVSRSQYLGAQRADRTLVQTRAGERNLSQVQAQRTDRDLAESIIHVLFKHACENGRHAYMRPSHIGKKIGTYRKDDPAPDDTLGRRHHKLLRELQKDGRVEHMKRIGWRLTEAEWNRLTLDE